MRKDMKDIIIDVVRRGGNGQSQYSRAFIRDSDPENLPSRIPMGRHRLYGYDAKEPSDRLSPLRSFLEKNVGHLWADVWHEICAHADNRTIRGYHLRTHVKFEVSMDKFGHHSFFVDDDGTLQKAKEMTRAERRRRWGGFKPTAKVVTKDPDFYYEKIDGFWYSFETVHIKDGYSLEDLAMVNGEVVIVHTPVKEFWRHETAKKQVDGETQTWLDEVAARKDMEWLEG